MKNESFTRYGKGMVIIMKKNIFVMALLVMVLLLTGCKSANNTTSGASNGATNENVNTEDPSNNGVEEGTNSDNAGTDSAVNEENVLTEVVIKHSLGTVTVPTNVEKAVVFDFGSLDTIDALGIDVTLAVPVDNLPAYLEKYSDSVSAGGIKEPDLEAIFDFDPDVIIISGRQSSYYDQLSEIAPTIYVELNAQTYMEDFKKNVNNIAQIFGVTDEANAKLAEIEARVEEVKAIAKAKEDKALVVLTNDGNISVYGSGSRFGIIHDTLGVKQADENIEASTHGQEANYEYIAKVNPDIIFVVDRTAVVGGTANASSTLDNELVNETNAAKNGNIISLNSDYWYLSGGGLISVNEMISNIEAAISK